MTSRIAALPSPARVPGRTLPTLVRLQGYEIRGVLAQSSFAVVYRAYDPALKRHVAIKEYLPEALALRHADGRVRPRAPARAEAFERGLQAFVAEAEFLARCKHPSLLHVQRVIRCHGTVYRVMPECHCPTLLQHRQQLAAPPAARTLRAWLDDLLGALQALHDEGCVHGAVAPGNVLLQPDGRPLLLDLDAVRGELVSDRTQSMMAALQPCFEPIEQRAPVSYMVLGPWTDLYALAATLRYCIDGRLPSPPHVPSATPPFEPLEALWQRLRVAHPALDAEPPWLRALDACLRESPQDRPQSVAQLRRLLDAPPAVLPQAPPGPVAAVPPQACPVAPAQAPGRRWLRPIGATTLLAVGAVLAIAAWPLKSTRDAAASSRAQAPVPAAASMPLPAAPLLPATAAATPRPVPGAEWQEMPAAPAPVVQAPPSPRQLCAGRARYALLQCMLAQCAKPAWTKHEQCRRLREENRLS